MTTADLDIDREALREYHATIDRLVKEHYAAKAANIAHKDMSLRDYFAGQVLLGLAVSSRSVEQIAKRAYILADAMLAARRESSTGAS